MKLRYEKAKTERTITARDLRGLGLTPFDIKVTDRTVVDVPDDVGAWLTSPASGEAKHWRQLDENGRPLEVRETRIVHGVEEPFVSVAPDDGSSGDGDQGENPLIPPPPDETDKRRARPSGK